MKEKLNKAIDVIDNWYHYPNQITAAAFAGPLFALLFGRFDIALAIAFAYAILAIVAIVYVNTEIRQPNVPPDDTDLLEAAREPKF